MKTKNLRNGIILGSLYDEMMPSSSQRLGLNSFVNCRLWDSNLDGEKFKRWRLWRSSHKSVPKSRAQLDSRTSGLGPTASLWSYRVIANSKRKCRTSHVKVSYFRNTFLVSSIIPKNEQKQFNLRYHSNKVDFFCSFLGELKIPKKTFRNQPTFSKRTSSLKKGNQIWISLLRI